MTIKDTIIEQLLDCADDPSGLAEVLKRHGRSKGPLYLALAEATGLLSSGLQTIADTKQAAQQELDGLHTEVKTLQERRQALDQIAQGLDRDIGQKEARLSEVWGLIETADRLEGQGFGKDNLEQLPISLRKRRLPRVILPRTE